MEKRLLLAIVLSFLVLFLYQALFVKREPPVQPTEETSIEAAQEPAASPAEKPFLPGPKSLQPEMQEKEEFQPVSEEMEEHVTVDTSLYHAVWSNKGAVLKSWRVKQHKDDNNEDLELVSSNAEEINKFPFSLQTDDPEFDRMVNSVLFKPSQLALALNGDEEGEIRFQYADDQGNKVEKTFVFRGGKYDFDIRIQTWKNGQKLEPRIIWGPSIGNPSPSSQKGRFGGTQGLSVYSGAKLLRHEDRKYDPAKSTYNFVDWAAYDDQYFAAMFITSPQRTSAVFLREEIHQIPYYFLTVNYAQKAYIGPKSFSLLSDLGYEAKKIVKFGFFGFIAEILYMAIKAVHSAVPNWGFSIIILTIIIKILFFPLTYSSTKSMARMQELQPKIKALKAKYKKARKEIEQRRKMNEETMRLYKEHGVNPAGGCLPMLIQLPIFWGFFRLLIVAIEFRNSPFILWINDLSVKDPFYVTPILMGITQFISQKMTPTSGDTTQQRMMLIMPVVMTIFFMNFQSGLVLYWLTNNVLQIGQQYIMNRFMQKKKRESHGKRRKK